MNKRIDNLLKERLSTDTIYKVLIQFDKLYDNFTDLEKKIFMQSFIEEVQIYEQPKANGRFLKSISFAFPVYYIDKEFTTIAFGEDALEEYAENLTKENLVGWDKKITGETVVQLSKGDINNGSSGRSDAVKTGNIGMIDGYSKGNKAPETTNVKIDFSLENLDMSELRGR